MNELMKYETKQNFSISYRGSSFPVSTQMTMIFVHTDVGEGGFAHTTMNNHGLKICSFRERMLSKYFLYDS